MLRQKCTIFTFLVQSRNFMKTTYILITSKVFIFLKKEVCVTFSSFHLFIVQFEYITCMFPFRWICRRVNRHTCIYVFVCRTLRELFFFRKESESSQQNMYNLAVDNALANFLYIYSNINNLCVSYVYVNEWKQITNIQTPFHIYTFLS